MLAGNETSSTALTWALYALAKHPASQDKLREELMDVADERPSMYVPHSFFAEFQSDRLQGGFGRTAISRCCHPRSLATLVTGTQHHQGGQGESGDPIGYGYRGSKWINDRVCYAQQGHPTFHPCVLSWHIEIQS